MKNATELTRSATKRNNNNNNNNNNKCSPLSCDVRKATLRLHVTSLSPCWLTLTKDSLLAIFSCSHHIFVT